MSIRRQSVPIPIGLHHGPSKDEFPPQDSSQSLSSSSYLSGSLSPHLSAPTPPNFIPLSVNGQDGVKKIGKYAILEQTDLSTFKAVDSVSEEGFKVKIVPRSKYQETFAPRFAMEPHEHINNIHEALFDGNYVYVFFPPTFLDIHTFIRNQRKLKEPQAAKLFYQIVSAVSHCHKSGVVLRDLKLRKFVFADEELTSLVLDNLEDAHILPNPLDDTLQDKHGCPAYVSPEILNTSGGPYSGKCADVWSVGVILYTMLVGRYPFHDAELSKLFSKIRKGLFVVPDSLSPLAKCLLHSILRVDPNERLTTEEILDHPWFHSTAESSLRSSGKNKGRDQMVPDVVFEEEDMFFFT